MTKEPPVTQQSLAFQWGDLYLICYARDRWAALRRGQHRFLTAGTLDELATTIEADYEASLALPEFGPPATADYPTAPDDGEDLDEDEVLGQDAEIQDLLTQLRGAFRQWAISYGRQTRAWMARKDGATICQNSAALLCIALVLIERRERQARHGPGWAWPPWGNMPSS